MPAVQVTKALEQFLTSTDKLRLHPKNVRRGNLDGIAASLENFGQQKPIVALPDGTIVAGNHTYMAATEKLGWTEIAAIKTQLSEEEALSYLLADNKASDDAGYEQEKLAELLNEMMNAGSLEGTGYSPDDVDDIVAGIDALVETAPEPFAGGSAETEEEREARRKDRGEQTPHREIVLLYEAEDYEALITDIVKLRQAWGMNSTRDAIREAVTRAVKAEGK